jgi:hypothetical protein
MSGRVNVVWTLATRPEPPTCWAIIGPMGRKYRNYTVNRENFQPKGGES